MPHRHNRLIDTTREVFNARTPITAASIGLRIDVRVEGVERCLRLLERIGRAERCGTTPDGRALWQWKELKELPV